MTNIEEGNKLIAESRGASFTDCGDDIYIAEVEKEFCPKNTKSIDLWCLKYHESWDWLMPVIEQIIDEEQSACIFTGMHYLPTKSFEMLPDCKTQFQGSGEKWIHAAWIAVVEYIEWKNKKS